MAWQRVCKGATIVLENNGSNKETLAILITALVTIFLPREK